MDTAEMTVQAAAALILKKNGHPLSLKELAKTVLKQRLVKSNAADPERSLAGTIDQNINEEREPKLVRFQGTNNEILVGLPEWKDKVIGQTPWWEEIKITVPLELYRKLQLAQQAGLKPSFEETVIFLLESGLKQEKSSIKEGLLKQIEDLQD
jgi:hypothetical protein